MITDELLKAKKILIDNREAILKEVIEKTIEDVRMHGLDCFDISDDEIRSLCASQATITIIDPKGNEIKIDW